MYTRASNSGANEIHIWGENSSAVLNPTTGEIRIKAAWIVLDVPVSVLQG